MSKSHKILAIALVIGAAAVVAVAAIASGTSAASAAPQPQTANNGPTLRLNMAKYADLFVKSFEGQLGINDAQLDAAFTGAAGDTIDQAVKDGVVTADQATQAKTVVKDGVTGLLTTMKGLVSKFSLPANQATNGRPPFQALSPASLAAALGLSSSDLETELRSGKSLADIAKEHNVDLQKVKDTILANVKSELDSAVSAGQLTQSQADLAYQALSQKLASMVSGTAPQGMRAGKSMPAIDVAKYANLFLDAFESRLSINDAKLDAAVAAAASDTLAQAEKDGVITSDQAARANSFAKMGVRQLASFANKGFYGMFGFAGRSSVGGLLSPATIASALSLNTSDVELRLKAGGTIADIAAAQHLDLAQVKQALLAQLKTELDAAVKNGKIQQTEADQIYAKFSGNIDSFVSKPLFSSK